MKSVWRQEELRVMPQEGGGPQGPVTPTGDFLEVKPSSYAKLSSQQGYSTEAAG